MSDTEEYEKGRRDEREKWQSIANMNVELHRQIYELKLAMERMVMCQNCANYTYDYNGMGVRYCTHMHAILDESLTPVCNKEHWKCR